MIQQAMERASRDLLAMRYFQAERLCRRALARAHAAGAYGLMSRIVLPLQEARRQKRQLAADAGRVRMVSSLRRDPLADGPGCYLVVPPLTARDARTLRERADARRIPALVLACEPPGQDGRWSVAAAGEAPVSVRVDPPAPSSAPAGAPQDAPPVRWIEAAAEALGDAAIAQVRPEDAPSRQVDELMRLLDALPDHEKLHQRLEEACRRAAAEPARAGLGSRQSPQSVMRKRSSSPPGPTSMAGA